MLRLNTPQSSLLLLHALGMVLQGLAQDLRLQLVQALAEEVVQMLLLGQQLPMQQVALVFASLETRLCLLEISSELLHPDKLVWREISKRGGAGLSSQRLNGGLKLCNHRFEFILALLVAVGCLCMPSHLILSFLRRLTRLSQSAAQFAPRVLNASLLSVKCLDAALCLAQVLLSLPQPWLQVHERLLSRPLGCGVLHAHEAGRVLITTSQSASAGDLVSVKSDRIQAVLAADLVAELQGAADHRAAEDLLDDLLGQTAASYH
mmetsp:Transcript_75644/g.131043  ORF Transcript_75644/g.131043 Transcript_75644/m.131043 type:complete len:263 (+) Transcript_75644:1231-2019(+)